ncbi:MAG: inorganic phosphate transporter, partial [Thermoplasmata archaeon]
VEVALAGAAALFAVSIGAHYTGACMGMPVAAGAIGVTRALVVMAPLAVVGALVASPRVIATVGTSILPSGAVSVGVALAIVIAALALTSAYNLLAVPTSTIQILVFSAIGAGLAAGVAIDWATLGTLLLIWAIAPVATFGLAFLLVRFWGSRRPPTPSAAGGSAPLGGLAVAGLLAVGAGASFTMGANDVANAAGPLVMSGLFAVFVAGAIGAAGLAIGVLTWGRPLLRRVAFRIVRLDARMAISAQLSQCAVVLLFVAFGFFTSLNQALVGAMIGAGVARRSSSIEWRAVRDILVGWAVGPASGAALGFSAAWLFLHLG